MSQVVTKQKDGKKKQKPGKIEMTALESNNTISDIEENDDLINREESTDSDSINDLR